MVRIRVQDMNKENIVQVKNGPNNELLCVWCFRLENSITSDKNFEKKIVFEEDEKIKVI